MFEDLIKNFKSEIKYDYSKTYTKKKIDMPPLSELPMGLERTRLYQRLYKQQQSEIQHTKNIEYQRIYNKPYLEKNREKLRRIITCECGINHQYYNKNHHVKSKRHIKLMENINKLN